MLSANQRQCGSVANCYIVLQEEVTSIVDCPDPDHMTPHERRVARIAHEEASFDAEYYLYNILPGAQLPHGDAAHPHKQLLSLTTLTIDTWLLKRESGNKFLISRAEFFLATQYIMQTYLHHIIHSEKASVGQGSSFVATGSEDPMDNDSIDDLLKFETPWREELVRWRRQKADAFASATAVP